MDELMTRPGGTADPPALRVDAGGVVRVGPGRVSLDVVVEGYEGGMTPEDMVRAYDALRLADVYEALGFYHRHRDAVTAYLKRRATEAAELRAAVEAERPRLSRAELLFRRNPEAAHAPAGD